MKTIIRKLIPKDWLRYYHKFMAIFAAWWYRNPSNELIVIGVTGTNGKSTTVNLIAKVLESSGALVGLTSTVNFKIGKREWLNNTKMTMLGRFALQRLLREMVTVGCQYAVIETSSEGIAQFRHLGINYDVAVFLNLSPEHIESHGGFANYLKAKRELFLHLTRRPRKQIQDRTISKVSVVNVDDAVAEQFLSCAADQKIEFSIKGVAGDALVGKIVGASDIQVTAQGSSFKVNDTPFKLQLLGLWNVSNSLAAIAVGQIFGLSLDEISQALATVTGVPGRMEKIDEGQDFTVIIDYAPQPQSVQATYDFLRLLPHERLIHVLGSTGGGRDKSRRPILGRLAGEWADYVIVTNEDPYDDDPMEIINQVAAGAVEKGKKDSENLFRILDRHEAIRKAVSMAGTGDIVLLTGKGAEQAMVVADRKKIPWDERIEARKALRELLGKDL